MSAPAVSVIMSVYNGAADVPQAVRSILDQTFGEMDRWQKNQISHRADAFRKLIAECFT